MRRFERSLTREMAGATALSFIALLAIFLVVTLVRVLGRAAAGLLEVEAVLPMLAFASLHFLPMLLSMALFIGVFGTLTRTWRDSEAAIWMSAGVGPWGWARAVLLFALPVVAVIALVSFELMPWSARQQAEFQRLLETRDEVATLVPGMFTEYGRDHRVHFVDSISPDGQRVGRIFVQSELHGRIGVMVAQGGQVHTLDNGERYLVLEHGHRYEGQPGQADFRLVQFATYSVRLEPQAVAEITGEPRQARVAELWANPTPHHMGEWVWRLGYPLTALLLTLFAIPMSYVNPRAARSVNVVFAILVYAAYNNFVGLSEGWVSRGKLDALSALLLVHGSMALIVAALFWRRFRGPWAR